MEKQLHHSAEDKPAASSPDRQRLIIASNNEGKLREFRKLLEPFGFDVISMRQAGFTDEIIEDGDTFEENAHIKARAVFEATGLPTIADDSGLEIDFLNGAPGIYSARYAGENATDKERCEKVLEEMHDVARPLRDARFVCSIYFILNEEDEYSVNGTVEGYIGDEMVGDNGFGYDPIFMLDDDESMATIGEDEKNRISHRAKAFEKLAEIFRTIAK
ncbi:MAG: XTP/dITP diphosphatase [Oscillospiraceae bacterium]|nr:XTP/dITP diphosphatase [Oscillospiraceae bacterium]